MKEYKYPILDSMESVIKILLEHGTITTNTNKPIKREDLPPPFIVKEPQFKIQFEPRYIVDESEKEIELYESNCRKETDR